MATPYLRLGTRGSPLALVQARQAQACLAAADRLDPGDIEIVVIRTSGDIIIDRPLSEAGGKGLFTKELDEALVAGAIDCAVHSAKDLPTVLPDEIAIAGYMEREDARDALICASGASLQALPPNARFGSAPCGAARWPCGCGPISKSGCCAAMSKRGCEKSPPASSTRRSWLWPVCGDWGSSIAPAPC